MVTVAGVPEAIVCAKGETLPPKVVVAAVTLKVTGMTLNEATTEVVA